MWASNNEGIGAWISVKFKSLIELKRFHYLDRRNTSERNRVLELKFIPNGEIITVDLRITNDIQEFNTQEIKARGVIVTIKDVYGVMNNGGSFGFIGEKCENVEDVKGEDLQDYLKDRHNYTGIIPEPLFPKSKKHEIISLNCRDSFSNTKKFDDILVKPGTKIDIICPESCVNTDAPVYGSNIYSKDSSLCKSAYHSGLINSSGGRVTISIDNPIDSYTSSLRKGIKSEGRSYSEYSITFEKFVKEDSIILKPGTKIDYYNKNGLNARFEKAIITNINESSKGTIINLIIEGSIILLLL